MTNEINNDKTEIGCPEPNCKKGKITIDEVTKLVRPEIYQQFIFNLAKAKTLNENLKSKAVGNVETKSSVPQTKGEKPKWAQNGTAQQDSSLKLEDLCYLVGMVSLGIAGVVAAFINPAILPTIMIGMVCYGLGLVVFI